MDGAINNIAGLGIRQQLALAWANQRSIAHNIANVNTPNFQATHKELIQNDQILELALEKSDSRHIEAVSTDGNPLMKSISVKDFSLDSEIGEMSKNNLFYQTLLEAVTRQNRMAKSVVEGR